MILHDQSGRCSETYWALFACWPISNASRRIRSLAPVGRNKEKTSAIDAVLQDSQKAAKLRSGENIDSAADLKKIAGPSQQRNVRQCILHLR